MLRPSVGVRIFLAGMVLGVAAVVGMLVAPLVHTVFHSWIGLVVPVAIVVFGWWRVARVRITFNATGMSARNTWRSFELAWSDVHRLDDATLLPAAGAQRVPRASPNPTAPVVEPVS